MKLCFFFLETGKYRVYSNTTLIAGLMLGEFIDDYYGEKVIFSLGA